MLNQLCQLANYGYHSDALVTLRQLHLLYLRQIRQLYLYISVLGKVISKIAPGTNMPRINARRSEDKANQNLLTGEAHTERFLSFDAIHARMNH